MGSRHHRNPYTKRPCGHGTAFLQDSLHEAYNYEIFFNKVIFLNKVTVCSAPVEQARSWQLAGAVYQDGSCAPHVLPELTRASWAAVQVDGEGRTAAVVSGVVPAELPGAGMLRCAS